MMWCRSSLLFSFFLFLSISGDPIVMLFCGLFLPWNFFLENQVARYNWYIQQLLYLPFLFYARHPFWIKLLGRHFISINFPESISGFFLFLRDACKKFLCCTLLLTNFFCKTKVANAYLVCIPNFSLLNGKNLYFYKVLFCL